VDSPCVPPVIKTTSVMTSSLPGLQFSTRTSPTCSWYFGLTLDPVTGSISGLATKAGKFDCNVLVTVNRTGACWKQSIPITFDIK